MKNVWQFSGKSQENGPLAEKWQDRKSKRTRQKNKTGDRKEESSDSPEIPDRGWGGDIRHPRPLFRGSIQRKFCCYLQSSDRSSYRLTMECLWLCSIDFQFGSSDCSHHTPPAGKYFLWQYLIFREWKRQKKTQSMSKLHSYDCQMWIPQSWQCQILSF